jgi:hypothetical protein
MAPRGERDDRIRDAARQMSLLDYTESDLRKYLGAEMGALNVKQNEGIIALVQTMRQIILALAAFNKEMNYIAADDRTLQLSYGRAKMTFDRNGEIFLATGDTSITMKLDGSIVIKGGGDFTVKAAGMVNIAGGKDITIKSGRELHLIGTDPHE